MRKWYGWQTLVADGAAMGTLALAGGASASHNGGLANGLVGVALGEYLLVPPLIHGLHGRAGIALLDFGMRALLPVATGGLCFVLAGGTKPQTGFLAGLGPAIAAFLGATGGIASATVIDSLALGWDEPADHPTPPPGVSRLRLVPTLAIDPQGGMSAGVAGVF